MRVLALVLQTVAAVLTLAAVVGLITGGWQASLGPIRLSATDPGRVALQAAVVWLVATLVSGRRDRFVMVPIVAVILTAWGDSEPRRVGDGAEYMAMAINMSHGRLPALSSDDLVAIKPELDRLAGFEDLDLGRTLVGRDGRQDFHHFWLYSLGVAPLMAVARAIGANLNHAFTVFNVALIALLAWTLVRRDRALAAALIVAGPLMWWIDKAHAEAFLFVMLAYAVASVDVAPVLAILAAALATAQNPAAVCVLAGVTLAAVCRNGARVFAPLRVLGAVAAAAVIAVLPAVYYSWHLGTWSPLAGTIVFDIPGTRAVLTTLVDPNLGVVPYAPGLMLLALFGVTAHARTTILVAVMMVLLLFVFALTGNVNHGGTPGMSRYALWLIALCTPLIAEGAHRLEQRRGLTALLICVSVGLSLVAFRPEWGDRAGDSPNPLAAAIWSRMPGLDNPLPEVFAERTTGADGQPPIPSATPGCEKVLVRGDGREAWWPFPCEPREAPPACTASGAVCYVNNGTFSIAPAQPRLTFDSVPERAWSIRQPNRLRELLPRLGPGARIMRRTAMVRRLVESTSLFPLFIVEGPTGTVFWAGTRDKPAPAIRIRALRASEIELRDGPSGTLIGSWNVAAGEHTVPVPTGARIMVIVTEST